MVAGKDILKKSELFRDFLVFLVYFFLFSELLKGFLVFLRFFSRFCFLFSWFCFGKRHQARGLKLVF